MRGLSRVVALFPGQGTQYVGMGKHLCETFPAAAAVFEEADQALGRPLAKLMWDGPAVWRPSLAAADGTACCMLVCVAVPSRRRN